MTALVLLSHGSVLCGAERGVLTLARSVEESGEASIVEVAFLNYSQPDLPSAVDRCVERGAATIVIVPFFLIAGKFVREELAAQIEKVRARHPSIRFVTGEALTNHPALADAILASAESAGDPHSLARDLEDAERYCRRDPQCPAFGTPDCPATEPTI